MREQKSFYTASSSSRERQLHFIGIRYPWHKEPKARDTSIRGPYRQDAQLDAFSNVFPFNPFLHVSRAKNCIFARSVCVCLQKFNYFRFSDLFGSEIEKKNGKLFIYAWPDPVANISLSIGCRSVHK